MKQHFEVAIVGAGFGGLASARRLLDEGIRDIVIFEKAGEVGGTWRDNTYPGCACDVPSNLYSFSFAPNKDWSRVFSPQPEIYSYLVRCSERFGLRSYIRFNTTIRRTRFDESRGFWLLTDHDGLEYTARVIVLATGPLSRPSFPMVPGMNNFQGKVFHSARWDGSYDLRGKRVAVIGTGASAIQVVPAIVDQVAQLTVFQRSAPWVLPKQDRPFHPLETFLFRYLPFFQKYRRAKTYILLETLVAPVSHGNEQANRAAEKRGLDFIQAQVKNPDLRRKITPNYKIGCKRILLSNDYYRALDREHVRLIPSPVQGMDTDHVVAANGESARVDAVIFCTGFHVSDIHKVLGIDIQGTEGRVLAEDWARDGMKAYFGATVSGYPNLFFILGPNSGLSHNSMVHMIESQANYLADFCKKLKRTGEGVSLMLKPEVQERFNREIEERMSGTAWATGGCTSWYLGGDNKIRTLWPGSTMEFRRRTRSVNPGDYEFLEPVDLRAATRPTDNINSNRYGTKAAEFPVTQ